MIPLSSQSFQQAGDSFGRREMEHISTIFQMGDGRYIENHLIS